MKNIEFNVLTPKEESALSRAELDAYEQAQDEARWKDSIKGLEDEVVEVRKSLAEKDKTITEDKKLLAEKDKTITKDKKLLAEKDKTLAEKDREIAELKRLYGVKE